MLNLSSLFNILQVFTMCLRYRVHACAVHWAHLSTA